MLRRPPRSTLTDPLLPFPHRVRSLGTADVIHERAVLEAAIEGMADAIRGDYADDARPPLFVTIMHGGTPFAAQLAFALGERGLDVEFRSEEHTSELQSLMRTSYAVFCLKKKTSTDHN